MTVLAKRIFFHSYIVQYVAAKDTSQLKMLYGYPEGNIVSICPRGACVMKPKTEKKKTENRDFMNLL